MTCDLIHLKLYQLFYFVRIKLVGKSKKSTYTYAECFVQDPLFVVVELHISRKLDKPDRITMTQQAPAKENVDIQS